MLERLHGKKIERSFAGWRPGDQPVFVSDISKASRELGWEPRVKASEGVEALYHWVVENKQLFEDMT
jgi:CDP-paratose 2-epimerase